MPAPADRSRPPSTSTSSRLLLALVRSVRSTAVAVIVAVFIAALREPTFQWSHLTRLALAYRWLWLAIFLGLLAWHGWRSRPPTPPPPLGR